MGETNSPAASFVGGGIGGFFDVFVHQPFDTIKVRMQSTGIGKEAQFRNSFDCFYKTVKAEGMRGLYRGMTIVILTEAPLSAIYFFGASIGKRWQRSETDTTPVRIREHFWAGCLGSLMTSVVVTPAERIKVLLQVEQTRHFGPVHVGKQLWKSGGLRSFYRGALATLLRDVPSGGVYLSVYEWAKRHLIAWNPKRKPHDLSILPTITAGGIAGLAACLVGMPPDVLKSRMQSSPANTYPQGMASLCRDLFRKEGFLAFYRGFAPVALYAFPGSAACMLGYELTLFIWSRFEVR